MGASCADKVGLVTPTVEEVVEGFIGAFNARDVERLLELVDEDVEVDFGHTTLRGRQGLQDFLERQTFGAAYRVKHGRRFQRGEELVAESRQELSYVENDELAGVDQMAAVYLVRNGRLTRYAEFPDLASAFASSGVSEADEVSPS